VTSSTSSPSLTFSLCLPLYISLCHCLSLYPYSSEIQAKADEEVASAQELFRRKVEETEILRKKMTEFHGHLSAVMAEKDNVLKIQNSLLAAQDTLKLRHRFLEISTRGKVCLFHDLDCGSPFLLHDRQTTAFLSVLWLFLLGFLYLLFLDSNLSSSCLARYS
jgi:hypothetical protein